MGGIEGKLEQLGFSEDRGLGEELAAAIKKDRDAIQEWRQSAYQSYAFEAGDQWDAEDLAMLQEQNRPAVVFNRIARTINAVAGMEIQNRTEVRFRPREQQDTGIGELLTGAAKWVRDECDAGDEESDAFRDLLVCGMGWTDTLTDFEVDQAGMIQVNRMDPLEMGWDHTARRKNLDDARRIWHVKEYSATEIKQEWPGAEIASEDFWPQLEGDDDHRADEAYKYENDATDGKDTNYPVIRVQWYEPKTVHIVLTEQGQMVRFDDERYERIAEYVEEKGLKHQKISKRMYYQAFMSGETILDIDMAPCQKGFSMRPMTGLRDRNKNRWIGLVQFMVDPQMWFNKWLSQSLFILNSNAKGGLLAEETAFVNPRKAEDDWSSPDSITWLNEGGLGKIQEKGQANYPQGFDRLMQHAQEAITDVVGISEEFLGLNTTNQVGYIEASRKQSGIALLATYFDALRRYRKEQGRVLADYIRNFISDGRLVRIVGQTGANYVPLMKMPDTMKYDIVVDDAPTSPNMKTQVFSVLMEMAPLLQASGIPVPPDLIDYTPLPEQLQQSWKKYIAESQQDPVVEQMKKVELADKTQEIEESRSKTALNYAKVEEAGGKVENEKDKVKLAAVKTGADIMNPNREMS